MPICCDDHGSSKRVARNRKRQREENLRKFEAQLEAQREARREARRLQNIQARRSGMMYNPSRENTHESIQSGVKDCEVEYNKEYRMFGKVAKNMNPTEIKEKKIKREVAKAIKDMNNNLNKTDKVANSNVVKELNIPIRKRKNKAIPIDNSSAKVSAIGVKTSINNINNHDKGLS